MKYLILVVVVAISGCASVKYNGPETKATKIDYPPIGQEVTAFVGDHLLQKGEVTEEKVLQVNQLIDGISYDIHPGVYPQLGHDSKASYYSAAGVQKGALSDPVEALMVENQETSEICVVTIFSATSCYKGNFERKTRISERSSSFQQTLIYSGRVGQKINIGYREFSNSVARPAFNNDVEYDLSSSDIIGYKGAQLQVLKADNTSITYKVLRSFP